MRQTSDRAGKGYSRLPRTIFVTVVALALVVTLAGLVMRMRTRRAEYRDLSKRYTELAKRYADRSRSDSDDAEFSEQDIPELEKMVRIVAASEPAQAVSLRARAETSRRKVEQLRAQAVRWGKVSRYYAAMRQRYANAAEHPWWSIAAPDGDPLDVEFVFLSHQRP